MVVVRTDIPQRLRNSFRGFQSSHGRCFELLVSVFIRSSFLSLLLLCLLVLCFSTFFSMSRRSSRRVAVRRDPDFVYHDDGHLEDRLWRVERIDGRRTNAQTGEQELLVVWAGVDDEGEPWPPSWEPAGDNPELLRWLEQNPADDSAVSVSLAFKQFPKTAPPH